MNPTTFDLPSDREARISRVIDAPRQLVWDAWTKPEHVSQWMLGPAGWTMPVCEMNLKPGGSWHYVWRRSDGTEMEMTGGYQEVAPPERLVSTERWGGDWPETTNILVLTETADRTTMTLTIQYPSKEARDRAMATGMKDGVNQSYDRLEGYVIKMLA